MTTDPELVGVMVIRAWVEGPTAAGLRAVIRYTPDITRREMRIAHAATVADVLAVVETGLGALLADRLASSPGPPPDSPS